MTTMKVSVGDIRALIREELNPDQTVIVYRGMTELTRAQVEALVHTTVTDDPSVFELNEEVPVSQSKWWSPHQRIGMAYATTDPIRGQKPGLRFDVLMLAKHERDTTDALKQRGGALAEPSIMVTHVLVAPRGKDRKATMQRLLSTIHP